MIGISITHIVSHGMIAYNDIPQDRPLENRRVIVQDIFDSAQPTCVFSLDFAQIDTPVVDAKFLSDGTQLQITYLSGAEKAEVTEVVDLN